MECQLLSFAQLKELKGFLSQMDTVSNVGIPVGRIQLTSINVRHQGACSPAPIRPAISALWHGDPAPWPKGARATLQPLDPIDEAWARVEADWGSEEAHRRFVGICLALDRLPEAGKRYRSVRETDPARGADAARHIETLIVMATQRLQDTRVAPATDEHKRTLTWVAFTIMLLLMGMGAWLLLRG